MEEKNKDSQENVRHDQGGQDLWLSIDVDERWEALGPVTPSAPTSLCPLLWAWQG